MKLKRFNELNEYKEIEFVCHNSDFKDSTPIENQNRLYGKLKQIAKKKPIVPYMQDFSDETHRERSLAVIILDDIEEMKSIIEDIAKKENVEIDMTNTRNDKFVDQVINNQLEGLVK